MKCTSLATLALLAILALAGCKKDDQPVEGDGPGVDVHAPGVDVEVNTPNDGEDKVNVDVGGNN